MTATHPTETTLTLLTEREIYDRAAAHKGATVRSYPRPHHSHDAEIETLGTFPLSQPLLERFAAGGTTVVPRPDAPYLYTLGRVFKDKTIRDWMFLRQIQHEGEILDPLELTARAQLQINARKRGVTCRAYITGGCAGNGDPDVHAKAAKVLAEFAGKDAHSLLAEMAASDSGEIVVSWTELALGGIKSLGELFREFANGRERLFQLVMYNYALTLEPSPHFENWRREKEPGVPEWVPEPLQASILAGWKKQTEAFIASVTPTS